MAPILAASDPAAAASLESSISTAKSPRSTTESPAAVVRSIAKRDLMSSMLSQCLLSGDWCCLPKWKSTARTMNLPTVMS
eukprot:3967930-Pyramimonas_sp.AAC.1